MITDKVINDIISDLLDVCQDDRDKSMGEWTTAFDRAMLQWRNMHPGTNPPCWTKIGDPPPCFSGKIPPIYDGPLGQKCVACN